MKPNYGTCCEYGEKPKTFDEKMKEGSDIGGGIAQSMSMRDESPWTTEKHGTTRSNSSNENI